MRRRDKTLYSIDRSMRLIELGPLDKPLVAKRDGWKTFVVDHATREELVEKYVADPNVHVERIEEVDAVWRGGSFLDVVPADERGTFDACIASHVIEHLPDPVGFLRALERILKPEGVVALVVPDKRYCFDFFQHPSSVGELLTANQRGARRHSKGTRFDYEAYRVSSRGEIYWSQGRRITDLAFTYSLAEAKRVFDGQGESVDDEYVDLHAWQFTPNSFELAMLELAALDKIDFHIARLFPTEGCEFHATLRRGKLEVSHEQLESRRLELLQGMLVELREQAELLDGEPGLRTRLSALKRRLESSVRAKGRD